MNLQTIKSLSGQDEYVLLPIGIYEIFQERIEEEMIGLEIKKGEETDYVPFDPADYIQNPIALARLKAGVKQGQLAQHMGVSQAYVSKLENADTVSDRALEKVLAALKEMKR